MKIAGVLLAGGQSLRYGQPKMFELFDGEPLYKKSLIALQKSQLCPVIIATNASLLPKFEKENIEFNIEKEPHQGPLVALQNIMVNFPDVEWFFVVASDMPCMNADFIQRMLTYIDNRYEAIVPKQASKLQPLASLYRRSALAKATYLIQQNKRSMKALLDELQVCYVEFDEKCSTFININTKLDLLQMNQKEFSNE